MSRLLKGTALAGVSLLVVLHTIRKVRQWRRRKELNHNCVLARAKREAALKNVEVPEVPPECAGIEEMSAIELAKEVTSKRITALQAVSVAVLASQRAADTTNAVTEPCFDDALSTANSIDYAIKRGESFPLAGVPISVKDSIDMKGYTSTCGLAARALLRSDTDSVLVAILKKAGAVPVVRSTTPQALMLPETMSRLWGISRNPWNTERTPGGSSGGEGVLLASRATWIGVGSDIGGSLRIPAHFCGVVAFKPTPQRVTRHGMTRTHKNSGGQESIVGVPGPMARSVDDCELVMRLWLAEDSALWNIDPYTPRVPWQPSRYHESSRSLRVGYYDHDGWFKPAPACARVVHDTVKILAAAGVECVPFKPRNVTEVARCYYALLSADGNMRSFMESCDGEELHPFYRKLLTMAYIPAFARPLLTRLLRILGWHRPAALLEVTGKKSAHEYWRWVVERKRLQTLWLDAIKSQGLDAIVCPALALPALRHGDSADLTPACSYTFLWNLLHWPAGVVPVDVVRADEAPYVDEGAAPNEPWLRAAQSTCLDSEGLPVAVQIATLPFQDEACLRLMRVVEQGARFQAAPQFLATERRSRQ